MFAYGSAGILGVLICGSLADRIGAVMTLTVICGVSIVFWMSLTLSPGMTAMLVLCACYGAVLTGLVASQGAAVAEIFRRPRRRCHLPRAASAGVRHAADGGPAPNRKRQLRSAVPVPGSHVPRFASATRRHGNEARASCRSEESEDSCLASPRRGDDR